MNRWRRACGRRAIAGLAAAGDGALRRSWAGVAAPTQLGASHRSRVTKWGTDAVQHVTDLSVRGNTRSDLARWAARQLSAAGNRIFFCCDEEACWRGWQITRRHGGLARTYRDPRCDTLVSCPRCGGNGDRDCEAACRLCDGTGRLARYAAFGGAP
jgi:hypothetical protein